MCMGYYWPIMECDCIDYIKKCLKGQQHAHLFVQLSQALQLMQSLWPFSWSNLDLIGKISPTSSRGHKFIIIATIYFMKWIEAIPMISTKGPKIVDFILHHLIYWFCILTQIVTDNGKKFKNKEVLALCKAYHIWIRFSTPYYPQGNGQAEATNKTIWSILIKTMNNLHRDWHLLIPHALWSYHTSIRTPTRVTPFSLIYGSKAVLSLEIEIPSIGITLQDYILMKW